MLRIPALLSLTVALALAAMPAAAQPRPFTVNVILSLTGPAANLGQDEATGLAALEALVNKTGGIRGTPLHFQIVDDQSQPAVAVQLLQQILPSRPAVVLGSSIAGPTLAMAALIKDGPLLYGLTPNFTPQPGGYVFATSAFTRVLSGAGVTYYRLRGLTKVATITTNDASGQNNMESLEAALALPQNKSMTVVDRETFSIGDVSVDAQAARIKASGAQVVFALPNGTSFGTALHGLYDVGLDVPVYTSAANFSPQLLERLSGFLPKELTCAGPSFFNRNRAASDPLKKPIDDFYAALSEKGVAVPVVTYAFAWDPGLIVVSAFRSLGTNATAAQVHGYIEGQRRFAGVQGIYDFTGGDQHGLSETGMLVLRSDPAHPGHPQVVSRQGAVPL
jgi:branched-chain amino acid transport system substrate-binding protein